MADDTEDDELPEPPVKKKRRRFTVLEKLSLVRSVDRRVLGGQKQNKACEEVGIDTKQFREWKKEQTALAANGNNKAKSMCKGMPSALDCKEEELLRFSLFYYHFIPL